VSDSSIAFCDIGIAITEGTVSRCSVQACKSDGIQMSIGTVSGCSVERNGARGIVAGGDGGCLITGNTCFRNNTSSNQTYAGITIYYSNTRVEDNNVSSSGVAGIAVNDPNISSNNVIIKTPSAATEQTITSRRAARLSA
jgi:parallel beta-helix repeat protein